MTNATPTAAALLFKDDEVLLVEHLKGAQHLTGVYGLPSGRVEEGETERDTTIREVEEETGYQVSKEDLVEFPGNFYIADIPRKDGTIKTFAWKVFLVRNFSGKLRGGKGETRPVWVKISKVDKLNLLPNVEKAVKNAKKFLEK